ncbi:MAG: hypothetical protein FJX47_17175, partial [Alphaproteobacteria bacterium]|nr:hypothetical protein [Alphaproteobacteria bacterium]
MNKIGAYLLQVVIWAVFAVTLGVLSVWPEYRHFPPDQAMIKLSFNHGGQKKGCRDRTPEELAKLS